MSKGNSNTNSRKLHNKKDGGGLTGTLTTEGETQAPDIAASEVKIIEKIGSGCFGTVYRGSCRGKDVAVKKLHQQTLVDAALEEFKKEVEIMTHLRHPNIVLLMGACTEPGNLMIITEMMPKGDVSSIIHNSNSKLSLLKKLHMAKDVAQGMNWLHCSNPPIIHRDVKPTNLLVDDNWNVKICDFGLSTISRDNAVKDNGMAPGTPLWMSPEVLQGKDLNEKVDIYSYGIVLWEMLTGEEPFTDHDSYNAFVQAVCIEKERPPIPEDMHASLSNLLELCWHATPEMRPTFETIIGMLDEAMVDCTIPDTDAAQMWKDNWMGKDDISFNKFVAVLARKLDLQFGRDRERNLDYKCLRAILTTERDENFTVNIEKFGNIIQWFGPLKQKRKGGDVNIVTLVKNAMQEHWFHGDLPRQTSEAILSDHLKKKGTYLIRLSTTDATKTPFTISKVNKKGTINHQRVFVSRDRSGYYVIIKSKEDKDKKLEAKGGIEVLINKVAADLGLKYCCPGRKYNELFISNKVEGYLPSPEDEDSDD
jgi:serine/threonine protein kinase